METKEAKSVARHAAATTAPNGSANSEPEGPAPDGDGFRKADEITLKVPNPLLAHQGTPPPQVAPAQPAAGLPHARITAKLKIASLAWDEFNSLPLTPLPVSLKQAQEPAGDLGSAPHPKHRGIMLALVAVALSAVSVGVIFALRERPRVQVDPLPVYEPQRTAVVVPVKPLDEIPTAPTAPVVEAVTPPPPEPSPVSKRHVSVMVQPAKATIVLDGAVVGRKAIALDLVKDDASHVLQAAAQGYLPFRKSFILEDDVTLHISLKKAAVAVSGGRPKPQFSEPIVKPPEIETKVKTMVDSEEEFGMDLKRPVRRQTKKMDEKDPYSP